MADTISILSEIRSNYNCMKESEEPYYRALSEAIKAVKAEPKKGRWILQEDKTKKLYGWHICSECGAWIGEPSKFCSECGADMRENI